MRVIAGAYRGRRLAAPRGLATRPTADRVREALFSMLGPLDGAIVLDLFAGTGALGIEALSRGAERAVFVERRRLALAALASNLSALEIAAPHAEVRAADALVAAKRAAHAGERYDLILLDPPYAEAQSLLAKLRQPLQGLLSERGRIVVEARAGAPPLLALPLERERRYGDTTISIHRSDDWLDQ